MANPTPKSAREKAAEARAAAEAADKRRRLMINSIIGAVLAVVVLALVGGAYWASRGGDQPDGPVSDAVQPSGAFPPDSPYKGGIPVGEAAADKPIVEIWEDFQCPACKIFEEAFGPTLTGMAEQGEAQVIWRTTSFLDAQFPGENSQRAAAAWGCAIDAGFKTPYHDTIYKNQPEREGDGWTNEQLLAFADTVGMTGQARTQFEQCFAERKYMSWAANGTAWMQEAGIPGTPGVYVNGQELPDSALASPDALRRTILEAGAPSAPSPTS